METVTLKGQDFKTIHNTLCDLRSLVERMTHSTIKIDDVQRIIQNFESGLQDAYEQDTAAFKRKMDHYDDVNTVENFRSIWSIFEIEDLYTQHPFTGAVRVLYGDHWGNQTVTAPVEGDMWLDLYRAADSCIRASGDNHHTFIERFTFAGTDLILQTGS